MSKEIVQLEKLNNSSSYTKAQVYADSLLLEFKKNNLESCKSYFQISLKKGESLENSADFNEALTLYFNILDKTEKLEYTGLSIETYLSIARLYEANERSEYCKEYLNSALEKMNQSGIYDSYGRYAIRNSSYHRLYGSIDTAIYYATLALDLSTTDTTKRTGRDANLLMGMLIEDTDRSIQYSSKAAELFIDLKSYYGATSQNYNIGKKLRKEGRDEESQVYFKKALEYAKKIDKKGNNYYYILYKIYDQQRLYYYNKGNIDSAYHYALLSNKYEIEASQKKGEDNLDRLEMQKKIIREEQKVDFLQEQKQYFQWALSIGALLLMIMSGLFIANNRNKKKISLKTRVIESKNKELEASVTQQVTLLSEIHHRVKNNLQLVISLLVLQSEKSKELSTKNELKNISDKVRSIALIHDQLYQSGEFDTISLDDYYLDLFSHFRQLKSFNYHIECNDITLNLETLIPLGIISAELINNSLKYADVEDLNLHLSINKVSDEYKLVFRDNGRGFKNGHLIKSASEMGTILIHSMIRQLNGTSTSYNENGAIFEFSFKEKKLSKI